MQFNQGLFTPNNPTKYVGDLSRIRFRSSWERLFMERLDSNPAIIRWASEPFAIPYRNPLWSDRISKYIPDFAIRRFGGEGAIFSEIVEIKPRNRIALLPDSGDYERFAWLVNRAKWAAAAEFAMQHGASFRLLTMGRAQNGA